MSNPLKDVTPLILTYNEEPNIVRTVSHIAWAKRIVVVDSGSTDATLTLLQRYPQVEIFNRKFDTHAQQWNHGLEQILEGWVLSLDADYIVTPQLLDELRESIDRADEDDVKGYLIPFRYCIQGHPLRGTILPPRIALFRAQAGNYVDDGHTQDLVLQGRCGALRQPLLHDDRKPLSRWFWAQERYLRLEAEKIASTPPSQLTLADRVRRWHIVAPFAVLVLCLLPKLGMLDGWRGWFYAFQRMYAELMLSLMLMEERLKTNNSG